MPIMLKESSQPAERSVTYVSRRRAHYEAFQHFAGQGAPDWLLNALEVGLICKRPGDEGRLSVLAAGVEKIASDGDFIVNAGGGLLLVFTAERFNAEFEAVSERAEASVTLTGDAK